MNENHKGTKDTKIFLSFFLRAFVVENIFNFIILKI
jgi:hypothetical protein